MSDYDIEMKVGDTRVIQVTLLDSAGAAINLTGKSVKFRLREVGGSVVVNDAAATVVNAASGIASYEHTAAAAGSFRFEFRAVEDVGGKITTYPGNGNKTLLVHDRA